MKTNTLAKRYTHCLCRATKLPSLVVHIDNLELEDVLVLDAAVAYGEDDDLGR